MPRNYTIDTYGATFALATKKFLDSGLKEWRIDCATKGEATNTRMRFNHYWKLVRATSASLLPPDVAAFQNNCGDLVMLWDAKEPLIAVMTYKSERKLDKSILGSMTALDQPRQGAPYIKPTADVAAVVQKAEETAAAEPASMDEVLAKTYEVKP